VEIKGPVLIEMFPKHDDFAVRNLGLPGMIGALGACFGKVVTLDSPHARPPGEYNWQPTLWHELAHVVSLQLSNNRVPRWLTEGISVWEERRGRPEWGWEMEVPFAQAMDAGKIYKLSVLNEGFSDPEMISLAYHEASLVAEYLAKTYGEPAMSKLLQAYGRGLETDAAVKEAFNVTLDDIQKGFDAELERHYRPLITALNAPELKAPPTLEVLQQLASTDPGSFRVQMRLGRELEKSGDSAAAIAAFERASKLLPWATGDDNPNKEIATIALAKKDNERAMTALEAVLKVDHADVEAARALIPLVAKESPARQENAYQRLVNVDPFEATAQASLGRLAMQRRDGPAAVKAFRTALAINPPDRAAALVDLGEAYVLARQPAQARTQALAALEIAPSYERAQDLLLKVAD
jgi:tetratricopeptide (TPR) repeat protein